MEPKYDHKKIKELRESLGLTLEKFGERLGKSRQQVQAWEVGITKISVGTIEQMCKEFGVKPNFFFDLKGGLK